MLYPAPFREQVSSAAAANGLPSLLVCSVVRQESLWDPAAVSRSGAVGLMQLMPRTAAWLARRFDLAPANGDNVVDPGWNTAAGCGYLKGLLDSHGGRLDLALAAYNAGPGRVREWASRPGCPRDPDLFIESLPFWETRSYVRRILLNYWEYRRIYPELRSPQDKTYLQRVGFSWNEAIPQGTPAAD
jgi:soluble lytic murein transglycosylase